MWLPAWKIPAYPELRGELGHRSGREHAASGIQGTDPGAAADRLVESAKQYPPRAGERNRQFQLVHIHPFLDGNGRTSRLLSTLCLYKAGYDFKRHFRISEYYDRDRAAFFRAIQGVREQDMDLTRWLEFFTAGLATQFDEVKARGERTIRRDVLVRQHALSDRQAVALGHVIEHGRLTIHDYERLCPGKNGRTLQRDLKSLLEKGLLAEADTTPTNPTRHYRLADGLVRSGAVL